MRTLTPTVVTMAVLFHAALGVFFLLGTESVYIQILALAVFLLTLGIAAAFYYHSRIRALSVIAEEHLDKSVDTSEETDVQPYPLELDPAVAVAPEITQGERIRAFTDSVSELAGFTAELLEKRQYLLHKSNDPVLAADRVVPNKHYLSFVIDDELFAVSILNVCSIVEATQLTTNSSMALTLRRAIRMQDVLVPVIDLGVNFGCPPIEIDAKSGIVILDLTKDGHRQMIGVVVDAVCDVLQIPPTDIEPLMTSDSKIRNDFTLGRATVNSLTFTLLDIGRGFSANDSVLLSSPVQTTVKRISRYKPSHASRNRPSPRD